jgi:hypothetical protein
MTPEAKRPGIASPAAPHSLDATSDNSDSIAGALTVPLASFCAAACPVGTASCPWRCPR